MKLKRFSQEADLAQPEKVEYFLVIGRDDGSDFRLPVPKSTIDTLIVELYGAKTAAAEPEEPPQVEEEEEPGQYDASEDIPTEFGGDDAPQDDSEFEPFNQEPEDDDVPASEDDVPSL